jgi:hypothetical protein
MDCAIGAASACAACERTSCKRQVSSLVIAGRRGQEVFRAGTEVFAQV